MTPTPSIPMSSIRRSSWRADDQSLSEPQPPPTVRLPVGLSDIPVRDPAATPPPPDRIRLARPQSVEQPQAVEPGVMPRPGETFLGFRIVEELGHGAFARVYLAEQAILAGRQVALKITLRPTSEAERLARLQHANIVPIYSVHNAPPVQVICMPFLGRKTISDLIRSARRSSAFGGSAGRRTWGTRKGGSTTIRSTRLAPLSRKPAGNEPTPPVVPAAESQADVLGDVRSVLELLSRLADGLIHAHERGILHLDLKPANILLADTGEPMLLDFNLSFDTSRADRDMIGGTVAYMAPEQLNDLRSRGHGGVDARTDLYGLGVVAFEMLTGSVPFPVAGADLTDFDALIAARKMGCPPIRRRNPDVTPAVEAIVRKLLAPAPESRYQSAVQFKTDLQRHLNDQPLRFARESSITERVGKWRRRNPRLLGRILLAGVIGLALGLGVVARNEASSRAAAVAEIAAKRQAQETRVGLDSLRLDLASADDTVYRKRGIGRAEAVLASYGLPDRADWHRQPAFAALPEPDRPALAADLGELLLLVVHARWQSARLLPDAPRRAAAFDLLALNRMARTCFTAETVPAFANRQAAELFKALGDQPDPVAVAEPTTAREHFLEAVAVISTGQYPDAIAPLERTIAKQPDHGAAHFLLALCLQQTGEYTRAVERYDVARSLLGNDPRPSLRRGDVFLLQIKPTQAEAEYTQALAINPECAEAYRNRGMARIRLAKPREAEQDLTEALKFGISPLQVYPIRAQLRDRLGDEDGARQDRELVRQFKPEQAADYVTRGVGRIKRDPKGALEDFQAAAALNPKWLPALQNQVHVLAEHFNDLPGALAVADRAVELYPKSAPARAGRALILARMGKRAEAIKEAEQVRVLSSDPGMSYLLACVYSRTSVVEPADRAVALDLLRKAYQDGYRELTIISTDRDLDPIRQLPEFKAIVGAMKVLKL